MEKILAFPAPQANEAPHQQMTPTMENNADVIINSEDIKNMSVMQYLAQAAMEQMALLPADVRADLEADEKYLAEHRSEAILNGAVIGSAKEQAKWKKGTGKDYAAAVQRTDSAWEQAAAMQFELQRQRQIREELDADEDDDENSNVISYANGLGAKQQAAKIIPMPKKARKAAQE